MTDDLVKRLREHGESKNIAFVYRIVTAARLAADRIEELEERLKAATDDAKEAEAYAEEIYAHTKKLEATELANRVAITRLEAKLAKAVGALEKLERRQDCLETFDAMVDEIVTTTLAALKGNSDG